MHHLNKLTWTRWSLAVRLTLAITTMIILVVLGVTLLSIRREQQSFRLELQQQASLLLDTLTTAAADPLYAADVDTLSDMVEKLGMDKLGLEQQVLSSGRIYDDQARILGDAYDQFAAFRLEVDPFGARLLASDSTVFDWQPEQLVAGRAVRIGNQTFGAISVGLPTSSLQTKIAAVRNQGLIAASSAIIIGALLALFLSRSITNPLNSLVRATERISEGDLSQEINVGQSGDELAVLGQAMERMRTDLQALYQDLEQQVAERTSALTETNVQLKKEIAEREQFEIALAQARDKALEASRLKSELLAKVSHELRTPLGAILGYTELLQGGSFGPVSEQQEQIMTEVIDSTNYLTNLVNELLDQAKLESGQLDLDPQPFELRDLVDQLESKMSILAQTKGLRLDISSTDNLPPTLYGDELRLQQILINLVSNAIKFTASGSITVRMFSPDPDHWILQVSDSGTGIPENAQAYIFEPFRQVDGSDTRQHTGTGLGLSIVKQITTLMGGEIALDSTIDQGSTFTITLPLISIQEKVL